MEFHTKNGGFSNGSDRINIMITISLCMIVKNEEETLAQCLD
jgi:hypothetical protein